MVVLLYTVEMEILNSQEAPDRAKFVREAAGAFRARAKLLRLKGQEKPAQVDDDRAAKLEAEAVQLEKPPARDAAELARQVAEMEKKLEELRAEQGRRAPTAVTGQVEFINAWGATVTVIVDGVPATLAPGKTWKVTKAAGNFTYEVRDVQPPVLRQLKAGTTYTIRIEPR